MRLKLLRRIIFISFLLLAAGLAYHQILRGEYYAQLSQNNRVKLIGLPGRRGAIYDRAGIVLAGTRTCFNVALLPQETKDLQLAIEKLSPILGIPEKELLDSFKQNLHTPFLPVVVSRDISKTTAIHLECKEAQIPGLVIQTEPLRQYRYAEGFCHLLGYLGRLTQDELKSLSRSNAYSYNRYQVQDLVGRSGVEEQFDHILSGQAGAMVVEVNNRGYKVRVLGSRQPKAGGNIYLTVDAKLQQFITQVLAELEHKGACIVLDVQNGEIKALVSEPGFDPNLFMAAMNNKPRATRRIKELLNSQDAVLFNRAISGTYPPGSIFKLVVAAAGLEDGQISAHQTVDCPGRFKVGRREFFCWNLDGHGQQDLRSALAHSCNVYFYSLGLALGPERISLMARKFGLGRATGIDLPYESKGFVPSKSWKRRRHQERWYDGETANFSIGQGYLLVTPLQMAQMISAVANGGYLIQPHIIRGAGRQQGSLLRRKLNLRPKTLEIIRAGMRQAIQDKQGTAHRAYIPAVEWAAKTGTAQTSFELSHGWFGGFYPFNQPRLAVLVFLEFGGSGGDVPAIIAKKIIEYIDVQTQERD